MMSLETISCNKQLSGQIGTKVSLVMTLSIYQIYHIPFNACPTLMSILKIMWIILITLVNSASEPQIQNLNTGWMNFVYFIFLLCYNNMISCNEHIAL